MTNGAFPLCNNFAVGRVASWTLRYQNFSVADSLWLLVVSGLNWIILGLYLEYALPKEYGRKKDPFFFLTCCCESKKKKETKIDDAHADDFETKYLDKACYENVPFEVAHKESENKILKVSNLEKTFDNGFKAVNGVNVKMYED
jgi:hypothetical protein